MIENFKPIRNVSRSYSLNDFFACNKISRNFEISRKELLVVQPSCCTIPAYLE